MFLAYHCKYFLMIYRGRPFLREKNIWKKIFDNKCLGIFLSPTSGSSSPFRDLASYSVPTISHRRWDYVDGGSAGRKASTYTQDTTNTDIHALSAIRTHDPSVRASEDSLYIRRRGYCDCTANSFPFTLYRTVSKFLIFTGHFLFCWWNLESYNGLKNFGEDSLRKRPPGRK
jgi:hypothetical protein